MLNMTSDLVTLQSIANTLESQPYASQRVLAKEAGMSAALMNAILKRFVERGWIMLTNVNFRKLSYALTAAGMAELKTRSQRFAKRTFEIANKYNDALHVVISKAKADGKSGVVLYGKSYVRFLIKYICSQVEIGLKECDIHSPIDTGALCLIGELEDEEERNKVLNQDSGCISVLNILQGTDYWKGFAIE